MKAARSLVPLYVASAVLTVGEGSFGLLVPPYMHSRGVSAVLKATFLIVSASFPAIYFGLSALLGRRGLRQTEPAVEPAGGR